MRKLWTFALVVTPLLWAGSPSAVGGEPIRVPEFLRCGLLGNECCQAPIPLTSPLGPLVRCNSGLGCDVLSDRCVQPCGEPGQVCCDGPDTRAPRWTDQGAVYSPTDWTLREMCSKGVCDTPSHRCLSCGSSAGGPCCPPDPNEALARCMSDHLMCRFDDPLSAQSGTCFACGSLGKVPCYWGCDVDLDVRNKLCAVCGADRQPPCDRGCNRGLRIAEGLCRVCGAAGQIPCDSGCNVPLRLQNGKCALCGSDGRGPCDDGCDTGLTLSGGVCRRCGANGEKPCDKGCRLPLRVASGLCRLCGGYGQEPCDVSGCDPGLMMSNRKCVTPDLPSQTCAGVGESCLPDNISGGMHCCQDSIPERCNFNRCAACVPHGDECQANGTQICCSKFDSCVLDKPTGGFVCDLRD